MKLLIIEDDLNLSGSLCKTLGGTYAVQAAYDGEDGLYHARSGLYDAIVLDLMLPLMDGYEVLAGLREQGVTTPVLILTARDGIADKLRGFRAGADDYLAKPFGVRELIARAKALLRRAASQDNGGLGDDFDEVIEVSGIKLDEGTHIAVSDKGPIELTPREFELLAALMRHAGKVLSRDQLLHDAWGWEYLVETKTVDTHVKRLRDKLEAAQVDPGLIETVRGYGYRFKVL